MKDLFQKFILNIDLSKIKVKKYLNGLKKIIFLINEMLKTFNCGVGFCLIVEKKNINKIKKVFSKSYKPYEIGYISKIKKKLNLYNSIKW